MQTIAIQENHRQEAKMKITKAGLAVALILIFSVSALAQSDSKTEKIIDELLRKSGEITTYRVDTKMETQMMGQTMITEGEMAFKKPNKMHLETTSNMMGGVKQEIFTTGDIVWTYMPLMKMATKIDLSKIKEQNPQYVDMAENADITKPFKGFPKDKIKYIEKKTIDGIEVHVFEVVPDLPGQTPQAQPMPHMFPGKIVFSINVENGLPVTVTMLAKDGSTITEQSYSNFRINVPIDDSEFEFTPPEGVQVMDMTEGTMNMMRRMQGSQPKSQ
jgi:outer membrane lipoprotein-sorting protein